MAAVHVETRIRASAQQVWQALAATGEAHRAFAGVLKDSGWRARTCASRRSRTGWWSRSESSASSRSACAFAYSVLEKFVHHSATMQVVARGANECDFVWIADVLPHAAAASITPLMEQAPKPCEL
jgi:hypothetical protein